MAVSVTWAATATTIETLPSNTGSAPDTTRKITHSNYDESGTLNSGSTPPATHIAAFLLTLSGGAATINLAALTGTNGATVDMTGLKPQIIRIKNLGANSMTFKEGASNGHNAFTATDGTVVPTGGILFFYTNDGTQDIGSSDRTWDVTGTGSQTAEVTIICG